MIYQFKVLNKMLRWFLRREKRRAHWFLYKSDLELLRTNHLRPQSLSIKLFGPPVRYRSIAIKSPTLLIMLAALYDLTGQVSLLREIASAWRQVTRILWNSLFQFVQIPDQFLLANPQLDLLTLGTLGLISYLLIDRKNKIKCGTTFKMFSLEYTPYWVKLSSWALYTILFLFFCLSFWGQNALDKIAIEEGRKTLAVGIIVAIIVSLFFLIRGIFLDWQKLLSSFASFVKFVFIYLILVPASLIIYQLWYMGFYPNNYNHSEASIKLLYYMVFAHFCMGLFFLMYYKYWTYFRDVLYFTILLYISAQTIEILEPSWNVLECRLYDFLGLLNNSGECRT